MKQSARSSDRTIASIAAQQHGIVTRTQLLAAGVSRHAIDRRLRHAQLRSRHAGVYQVGPVALPRSLEMAAVLACDGATLSHRSAAAFRDLTPPPAPSPLELTISPDRRCGRRQGIRVYRRAIADDEIERIDGIPVTSAARTVLDLAGACCSGRRRSGAEAQPRRTGDCNSGRAASGRLRSGAEAQPRRAGVVSARELERALAAAERAQPRLRQQLASLLLRYPRAAGIARLRLLLRSNAVFTRSEAEEQLLDLIRNAGLDIPEMNVMLHGYEVDCYWKRARLVIEVDGFAFHRSARSFLRDHQRDSALVAEGIQIMRLTWHQIEKERDKTLVQITRALMLRSHGDR
jgi:very-short-patch-repair endonuclease